jgi:hypothetical protein
MERLFCQLKSMFLFALLFLSFMGCSSEATDSLGAPDGSSGVGGSFARLMIVENFMYLVDNEKIKTLDISDAANPTLINEQLVAEGVESIFRLGNRLFIGSTSGLFLYSFGADGIPKREGSFDYGNLGFPIYPCDPVVANDSVAYVTLNTTLEVENCNRNTLEQVKVLNIFDVSDIQNPLLLKTYDMLNPQGLGLDGQLLFVCDNEFGLKIYDISDPLDILLVKELAGFTAHDVIPLGGLLLIVGPENVYQIDYTDLSNIHIISTIPIGV